MSGITPTTRGGGGSGSIDPASSGTIPADTVPPGAVRHPHPATPPVHRSTLPSSLLDAALRDAPVPFVLGLTGSIGMGKSTVGRLLSELGVPVLDSDRVVHDLYAPGGPAVAPVLAAFPGVESPGGGVDRAALGRRVLGDPAALQELEAIVHPAVREIQAAWVRRAGGQQDAVADDATDSRREAATREDPHAAESRREAAAWEDPRARPFALVLDIPLLFETAAEGRCHGVLVVSAPEETQRARVLARSGMVEAKLEAILARQMPDAEKRSRAHHIIDTGCSLEETRAVIAELVTWLRRAAERKGYDGAS